MDRSFAPSSQCILGINCTMEGRSNQLLSCRRRYSPFEMLFLQLDDHPRSGLGPRKSLMSRIIASIYGVSNNTSQYDTEWMKSFGINSMRTVKPCVSRYLLNNRVFGRLSSIGIAVHFITSLFTFAAHSMLPFPGVRDTLGRISPLPIHTKSQTIFNPKYIYISNAYNSPKLSTNALIRIAGSSRDESFTKTANSCVKEGFNSFMALTEGFAGFRFIGEYFHTYVNLLPMLLIQRTVILGLVSNGKANLLGAWNFSNKYIPMVQFAIKKSISDSISKECQSSPALYYKNEKLIPYIIGNTAILNISTNLNRSTLSAITGASFSALRNPYNYNFHNAIREFRKFCNAQKFLYNGLHTHRLSALNSRISPGWLFKNNRKAEIFTSGILKFMYANASNTICPRVRNLDCEVRIYHNGGQLSHIDQQKSEITRSLSRNYHEKYVRTSHITSFNDSLLKYGWNILSSKILPLLLTVANLIGDGIATVRFSGTEKYDNLEGCNSSLENNFLQNNIKSGAKDPNTSESSSMHKPVKDYITVNSSSESPTKKVGLKLYVTNGNKKLSRSEPELHKATDGVELLQPTIKKTNLKPSDEISPSQNTAYTNSSNLPQSPAQDGTFMSSNKVSVPLVTSKIEPQKSMVQSDIPPSSKKDSSTQPTSKAVAPKSSPANVKSQSSHMEPPQPTSVIHTSKSMRKYLHPKSKSCEDAPSTSSMELCPQPASTVTVPQLTDREEVPKAPEAPLALKPTNCTDAAHLNSPNPNSHPRGKKHPPNPAYEALSPQLTSKKAAKHPQKQTPPSKLTPKVDPPQSINIETAPQPPSKKKQPNSVLEVATPQFTPHQDASQSSNKNTTQEPVRDVAAPQPSSQKPSDQPTLGGAAPQSPPLRPTPKVNSQRPTDQDTTQQPRNKKSPLNSGHKASKPLSTAQQNVFQCSDKNVPQTSTHDVAVPLSTAPKTLSQSSKPGLPHSPIAEEAKPRPATHKHTSLNGVSASKPEIPLESPTSQPSFQRPPSKFTDGKLSSQKITKPTIPQLLDQNLAWSPAVTELMQQLHRSTPVGLPPMKSSTTPEPSNNEFTPRTSSTMLKLPPTTKILPSSISSHKPTSQYYAQDHIPQFNTLKSSISHQDAHVFNNGDVHSLRGRTAQDCDRSIENSFDKEKGYESNTVNVDNGVYYAVAVGRKTGIFYTWDECNAATKGYSSALFKKFNSSERASEFIANNYRSKNIKLDKIENYNKEVFNNKEIPDSSITTPENDNMIIHNGDIITPKSDVAIPKEGVNRGDKAFIFDQEDTEVCYADGSFRPTETSDSGGSLAFGIYYAFLDKRICQKVANDGFEDSSRSEIYACIAAVENYNGSRKHLVICTDSAYVVSGFYSLIWASNYVLKRRRIANHDLFYRLVSSARKCPSRVHIVHINKKDKYPGNIEAHNLACKAVMSYATVVPNTRKNK